MFQLESSTSMLHEILFLVSCDSSKQKRKEREKGGGEKGETEKQK